MKRNKIIALAVAVIMCVALFAACSTGGEAAGSAAPSESAAAPSEEAAAPSEEASAPEEPAAPAEEPSEDAETPGEDPGTSVEGEVESLVDSLTDFEHKTETEIIEAAPVDEIDWSSLTVGFSQMENNMPWRIAQTESMQAAADEYGVNYIYADAQSDSAKQASDIEDMIAQGCDYIALAPRVEEGLDRILQTAKEQGTQIIIVDRMTTAVPGQDYLSNIVTNLPTEGLQVGEWMVDALTEKYGEAKGNVVTLQGTAGAAATIGRQNGFLRAIDGTDIQIIADQYAEFTLADAQAAMENILQAHGDEIDAVFCHSDEMCLGAIQAIEAYGLEPGVDILIGGVDGQGTAFEDIKAGRQNVTITCDPFYGPSVFAAIATVESGGTVPPWIQKEGTLITKENVEENWDLQF